jgi:hypothetical protein
MDFVEAEKNKKVIYLELVLPKNETSTIYL